MKLYETVALVADRKAKTQAALTGAYQAFQKPPLFAGMIRTYKPSREDEPQLPPEAANIHHTVAQLLDAVRPAVVDGTDMVLTQDMGNCMAKGTVSASVNGKVLSLADVPAAHLLFLEKQAVSICTMIDAIPTLDPSEKWEAHRDNATGLYKTEPVTTVRTRKVKKGIVLYPATPEHPAQTQLIDEDIVVGSYDMVKFSGAIPMDRKRELAARALAFKEAVIAARQRANDQAISPAKEGDAIYDFIFGA